PVAAGHPGAEARARRRNDPLVAMRRGRARDAGGHRGGHVDLSRAPRGRAPTGRGAAVRDVMEATLVHDRPLVPVARSRRPRAIVSLVEIVREACYGLYHHRFRAALSMLGISWGIISVVVLLAYGDGFRGALDAGFHGAFSDGTVVTFPGQTSMQAGGERAGKRVRVTADDVAAVGELPLVKNVSPEFMQEFPIVYGNKQSNHLIRGVAASYGRMRSEKPQAGGRFLEDDHARLPRRGAV